MLWRGIHCRELVSGKACDSLSGLDVRTATCSCQPSQGRLKLIRYGVTSNLTIASNSPETDEISIPFRSLITHTGGLHWGILLRVPPRGWQMKVLCGNIKCEELASWVPRVDSHSASRTTPWWSDRSVKRRQPPRSADNFKWVVGWSQRLLAFCMTGDRGPPGW
jgi:hypothetical protein